MKLVKISGTRWIPERRK